MEAKFFAVIDVGTQSLRAALVGTDGRIAALERESYSDSNLSPKPGYCEQWPGFYWERMVKALRRLTFRPEFKTGDVIGLALCDFRDTAALLGTDYEPVRPSILWLDPRNAKLEKDRNLSLFNRLILPLSGMMATARYNGKRTSAQWLKENEPDTWRRIAKYVPLSAYFNFKLTGSLAVSSADCIGHYPVDFKRGRWLPKGNLRWQVFGIEPEKLCDIVPCGKIMGRVSHTASLETGLPEGLPLYACASDKACEVLGNGSLDSKLATISYGTACTIDLTVGRYKNSEPFLPAYQAPIQGLYDMEIQVYRGFWMLKWFSDNFASDEEKKQAREKGCPVEHIFDEGLNSVEPGSAGLLVQPYWGPGLRRPNSRGSMVGFSDVQDKRYIYRAIIEGIAYSLREGLETLEKRSGKKAKALAVSGGGSRSKAIQQITADIFGLDVYEAETSESCSVGAAISGFVSAGVYRTAEEAVSRMVRYSGMLKPDPKNRAIYDRYYRCAYKKLFPKLNKIEEKLKTLSSDSEIG